MKINPDALQASSIALGTCECCGRVSILFCDDDEEVFAEACFDDVNTLVDFAGELVELLANQALAQREGPADGDRRNGGSA